LHNHGVRRIDRATGIITAYVGNDQCGAGQDGVPAVNSTLCGGGGLAFDSGDNLYVTDATFSRVRRVDAASGIITTVAGNGTQGFSGDGGLAVAAQLFTPFDVAVSRFGDLCISDTNNRRIRRVSASTGVITTIAGNGSYGASPDGMPAVNVSITHPWSVAFDAAGDCYFAEQDTHRIRRIDHLTGLLWTAAGTGDFGFNGDGLPAVQSMLNSPRGAYFDTLGALLIADMGNGRVRRVEPSIGRMSTVAGNGEGFSGDGGPALNAQLEEPRGLARDGDGNLYLTDSFTHRVRRVSNIPPSAQAGADAEYPEGASITLDGSSSYDLDGDPLTYRWTDGSGSTLSTSAVATVTRTPGSYTFTLAVTDDWAATRTDSVTVVVRAPSTPTATPTPTPTPSPTPTPTPTVTPTPTPRPVWSLKWQANPATDGTHAFLRPATADRWGSHPGVPHAYAAGEGRYYRIDTHYPPDVLDLDRDRSDRQRNEVVGMRRPDGTAVPIANGETWRFKWSMYLPSSLKATTAWTHVMRLRGAGGGVLALTLQRHDGVPRLDLRVFGDDGGAIALAPVPIHGLQDTWLDAQLDITFANGSQGAVRWRLAQGSNTIVSATREGIDTWRDGDEVEPMWGIHRSIDDPDGLRTTYTLITNLKAFRLE
jgi:hypothetical protein